MNELEGMGKTTCRKCKEAAPFLNLWSPGGDISGKEEKEQVPAQIVDNPSPSLPTYSDTLE